MGNQWWLVKLNVNGKDQSASVIANSEESAKGCIKEEFQKFIVAIEPKGNGEVGY